MALAPSSGVLLPTRPYRILSSFITFEWPLDLFIVFNRHLLNAYCMPDTDLAADVTTVNKIDMVPAFREFVVRWEDRNKIITEIEFEFNLQKAL